MIRRALPFAVFLSAMGSLSVELAIVRLGAPYVGQSLLPWSAAIASVLIGLTAGHGLGGVVGGEAANRRALRVWLGLVWLGGACGAALMPLLVGQAARIFAGDGGFGPGIPGLGSFPELPVDRPTQRTRQTGQAQPSPSPTPTTAPTQTPNPPPTTTNVPPPTTAGSPSPNNPNSPNYPQQPVP